MASLLLPHLFRSSMLTHSQLRRCSAAGLLPVILVLAALAAGAAVFFIFTKPRMDDEAAASGVAPVLAEPKIPAAAPSAGEKTAPAAPPPPVVTPPPAPAGFGFARPADLGKEMARSLAAADFDRAAQLAAASDPAQAAQVAAVLKKMVLDMKVKAGSEDQVEILGLVENRTRVSVPLLIPGREDSARLQLDLERDARMGWKVVAMHLPKELAAAVSAPDSAAPAPAAPGQPPAAEMRRPSLVMVDESMDPLSFASDFVRALLRHDFARARIFVDEAKVPAERLIGLCIVFEEGKYELKPAKPLIITVANPEVSWVIAQVQSTGLQQSTEFGLELQRAGVDKPWRVVGMNLSEILGSYASSAAKMGVPYTPIVSNPRGGESLALYFEYDEAALHPRAQKQLEIVAGLLKSDPNRKLKITGHADAKGAEDYNVRLSRSRAESVKSQLAALGVSAAQIVTTGLGTTQPLSPNQKSDGSDDPEGRSRNRRAEIYLDF